LAKTLIPEPEIGGGAGTGGHEPEPGGTGPAVSGGTEDGKKGEGGGDGGGVVIKGGERRLNRVRIDMRQLPWENWLDIYNEVIQPLANEGAEVSCQVVILAKGDAAIRENTVELGIKESLSQSDIEADIQTGKPQFFSHRKGILSLAIKVVGICIQLWQRQDGGGEKAARRRVLLWYVLE